MPNHIKKVTNYMAMGIGAYLVSELFYFAGLFNEATNLVIADLAMFVFIISLVLLTYLTNAVMEKHDSKTKTFTVTVNVMSSFFLFLMLLTETVGIVVSDGTFALFGMVLLIGTGVLTYLVNSKE